MFVEKLRNILKTKKELSRKFIFYSIYVGLHISTRYDIISLISYKKILDIVTFTLMSDREKVTLNNHILVWYRTNTDSK